MLGLPKSTELKKQLPKNVVYSRFNMTTAMKERFDSDIKKMVIVNEVSTQTTSIAKGSKIEAFFVILVLLKQEDFNEKNMGLISKLINQNMIFVLQYEDKEKLVIYHQRLIQSEWRKLEELSIELKGLNLDTVWENIVKSFEGGEWNEELSLEENITLHEKQERLSSHIEKLEKQARREIQPRRKFGLVEEIYKLRKEME